MSHSPHATNAQHDEHHGSHAPFYWKIFGALIVLTVVTVGAAQIDMREYSLGSHNLGWMNIVMAMIIASCKAGLVAYFFMHLKVEDKLTWIYAGFPLILMVVLIAGVFIDEPLRINPTGARFEGKVVELPARGTATLGSAEPAPKVRAGHAH